MTVVEEEGQYYCVADVAYCHLVQSHSQLCHFLLYERMYVFTNYLESIISNLEKYRLTVIFL